jgi:hypothetical protein
MKAYLQQQQGHEADVSLYEGRRSTVCRIQTERDRVSWPEQLSTCQAHGGNCVLGWRKGNGNGNFHDVGADHISGNHKSRQAKTCVPSLDDTCSHAYAS